MDQHGAFFSEEFVQTVVVDVEFGKQNFILVARQRALKQYFNARSYTHKNLV